uniref:Glutamate [NMDA] receptor subunit 1 n=1 Tax=Culicoides sonorensis TaxID=179676 RepID=A0A336KU67_CULSO
MSSLEKLLIIYFFFCILVNNVLLEKMHSNSEYPTVYNIGGVLSGNESETYFATTISHLNFNQEYVPKGITYYDKTIRIDKNPIKTALNVCKHLISKRVFAVVVSHEPSGDLSPAAVSYTSGFYQIPVIGISSRDAAFSDKNIHVSFLRTVPPYYHQADVWLEMLNHFAYTKVIIIHSSDTDGRAILGRFQTTSQTYYDDIDVRATVEDIVEFEPKLESFSQHFYDMKAAQSRVYLLYAKDAKLHNLTGPGHVWIVTEQALNANNVPPGVLGLELHYSNNEREHIREKQKMRLKINDSLIVWPGGIRKKPEGIMIPTHLKVLTIEEKPFVYVRKLTDDEAECEDDEIPCPHYNSTDGVENYFCCKGYCMDLLKALATRINFTYDLALSPDGQFGHYILKNTSTLSVKKEWTGLIGELVYERADLIVAPLTINPERAEFIEFSKPFKYQGITILEKKPSRSSTLVSFLQPFSNTLWILVMVSVHVVALVLYLLDRFSPFGRYKLTNSDGTEEDALNLSGIGEGTPRSFSARVLGMVWAGFAMIIVASYTANLAAFLVLERPKTKLSGINDARLRNTMENLTCATVKGSAVDMYFRRQVELSNMYRTMEANNYDTAEQAVQDVKDRKLMAFIWDSSRLEYEAAKDCELVTAGELFGRSGYGIGLQKNSPWTDAVTLAILDFHESGFMESLDKEWIFHGNIQQCEQFEKTPNTLGLKNMAGVFILVGAGIIGGIGLIIIEVVYKKHQIKKNKRLEIARHAADKWRGTIEKRKTLRASLAMQRQYNVGLNSVPKTISSVVDRNRYPRLGPIPRTGPERAWPGGTEIAKNRKNEESLKGGPPKYLPAYTTDVSHLVV